MQSEGRTFACESPVIHERQEGVMSNRIVCHPEAEVRCSRRPMPGAGGGVDGQRDFLRAMRRVTFACESAVVWTNRQEA